MINMYFFYRILYHIIGDIIGEESLGKFEKYVELVE